MWKTTGVAVVVALAFAGCGGGDVRAMAADSDPPLTSAEASADLWAVEAYGMYGSSAVETCLAAFHVQFSKDGGAAASYRSSLAEYLCACAQGQSQRPCPRP
jgi:hypothetical protein